MNEQEIKELVQYRINRAKDTLNEVNIHVENELWNTGVNRLYYTCFYAVSALLLQHKIQTQTHAGVRQMFGLHFVKKGLISRDLAKFYTDIFDKRQISDYDDYIEFNRDEVVSLIPLAEQLIEEIEKLIDN
jgi:uncharacterized protein (UPF0332 family)